MRFKRVLLAAIAVVMFTGVLPAGAALPQHSYGKWLTVNSPPSYCGYTDADINSDWISPDPPEQTAFGRAYVFTSNTPCSAAKGVPSLPANWLKVRISIRCSLTDGATEWTAVTSAWDYNGLSSNLAQADLAENDWCGSDDTVWSRTRVESSFYIYPTGWTTTSVYTTAWVYPA